jgi:hypothetical protein
MTPPRLDEGSEREAFEEYERTHHWQGLERFGDTYKNATVRNRWVGWKARAARPLSTATHPRAADEPNDAEFEDWLRMVCLQKPSPEAFDLARDAYRHAAALSTGRLGGEAEQWHAVLSPSRNEGVIFKSERDAKWTATGVLRTGFGVPVIGEAFRDAYDETSKFVIETVSAAPAAKPQGDTTHE